MTTAVAVTGELSSLDATFWALESRQHPMHLGALLRFGPGADLTPERLADLLAERAGRSSRLRQWVHVPGSPFAAPRWIEDPHFLGRRHVHVHDAIQERELPQIAAALMAEPLHAGLPPWQAHLLCDGSPADGFSLLLKLHHAAVDGLRAVELAVRMFDRLPSRTRLGAPEPEAATEASATAAGTPAPAAAPAGTPAPVWELPSPRALASGLVSGLASGLDELTRRRIRQAGVLRDVAGVVLTSRLAQARSGSFGLRATSPLHAPLVGDPGVRVLALPSYPLDDLQRIRRAHGGMLHDVVLAVLSGALRRWFLALGEQPDARSTRVLVPVSRRTRAGEAVAGNELSGYLVTLPVGEPDPLIRLLRVREAMAGHKDRGPDRGAGALATLTDLLPPGLQRFTGPLLRPTAPLLFDALVTDVPLPGLPFALAGAPLAAVHPLAPVAQGHTAAFAVSRLRDRVHFGIHGLARGPRDPRDLAQLLRDEIDELLELS